MTVESVTFDLGDTSPHVHLMESEAPYRHLSVPIALPEAQALYAALTYMTGRRPSTHELASAIIRQFQADIIAVRVTRYEAGVFYAELDVMTPRGREVFDARPSDAFILALRQAVSAPILCDEEDVYKRQIPETGRNNEAAVIQGVTPETIAVDITYAPALSAWRTMYRAAGCRTQNGLGMLAYQAARQMSWWFETEIDGAELMKVIS